LTPGDHEVLLRKEGYKEWRSVVVIEENNVENVRAVLDYAGEVLDIQVEPAGASLFVDGNLAVWHLLT